MLRCAVLIGVLSVCVATPARGDATVKLYAGYGGGLAGELGVHVATGDLGYAFSASISLPATPSAPMEFATFSVNRADALAFNTSYHAALGLTATGRGWDAQGNFGAGAALDPWAACLYAQFATGQLAGYRYDGSTAARGADATALQETIWFLQHESSYNNHNYNAHDPAVAAAVLQAKPQAWAWWQIAASANWLEVGAVRVLNLADDAGHARQSQLILTSAAPAPTAVVLAALGGLLAAARRRSV